MQLPAVVLQVVTGTAVDVLVADRVEELLGGHSTGVVIWSIVSCGNLSAALQPYVVLWTVISCLLLSSAVGHNVTDAGPDRIAAVSAASALLHNDGNSPSSADGLNDGRNTPDDGEQSEPNIEHAPFSADVYPVAGWKYPTGVDPGAPIGDSADVNPAPAAPPLPDRHPAP